MNELLGSSRCGFQGNITELRKTSQEITSQINMI